jgi:transketolase
MRTANLSTEELAQHLRAASIEVSRRSGAAHVASCLSISETLAVLFNDILRGPRLPRAAAWDDRDRFILSKGQAAAAVYIILNYFGMLSDAELRGFNKDGSLLTGQISHDVPGVEISTGSLGHGLPIGCGIALAAKRDGRPSRVFVLVGDGECNEGTIWESALIGTQQELDNLVVVLDNNRMMSMGQTDDVLSVMPLREKWEAFGWAVKEVDGHNVAELRACLGQIPWQPGKPHCIIANTVKGKGVSFMEHTVLWHYRVPEGDEFDAAMAELRGDGS